MAGRVAVLAVLAAAIAGGGCGPTGSRQPVSGTVTFQGRPLDRGRVIFLYPDGRPGSAAGAPIAGGKFAIPAEQGLDPGTYRVSVSATEAVPPAVPSEKASPEVKELIPAKHNTESKRTVEVTAGGPNRFDLDLD